MTNTGTDLAVSAALGNLVELPVYQTDMVLTIFGDNPNGPRLFDDVATSLMATKGRPVDPEILTAPRVPAAYVLAGFVFTCSEDWRQDCAEPALEFRLRVLWGDFAAADFVRLCGGASADSETFARDADTSTDVRLGFSGPYEWLLAKLESFLGKERPAIDQERR